MFFELTVICILKSSINQTGSRSAGRQSVLAVSQ